MLPFGAGAVRHPAWVVVLPSISLRRLLPPLEVAYHTFETHGAAAAPPDDAVSPGHASLLPEDAMFVSSAFHVFVGSVWVLLSARTPVAEQFCWVLAFWAVPIAPFRKLNTAWVVPEVSHRTTRETAVVQPASCGFSPESFSTNEPPP